MKRLVLAAAALFAAACSTGPTTVGLRLNEPSAIVAYAGIAHGSDLVRPLLAVASRRGDELRLIDPSADLPIFGPGVIYPLSIPTAPRPQLLASASLGDGEADLLVAASAGPPGLDPTTGKARTVASLQVIKTWTQTSRVAFEVSLDALTAGSEILSVLGIPGVTGGGKARLLVGATGGQLAVVDFTRGTQGEVVLDTATPVLQTFLFDAVDMALLPPPDGSPSERRVFLASRDQIGTGFGVAELDATVGATATWTPLLLEAHASTVAVAAGWVYERVSPAAPADPCSPYAFTPVKVPRVYAALDESRCGAPGRSAAAPATHASPCPFSANRRQRPAHPRHRRSTRIRPSGSWRTIWGRAPSRPQPLPTPSTPPESSSPARGTGPPCPSSASRCTSPSATRRRPAPRSTPPTWSCRAAVRRLRQLPS